MVATTTTTTEPSPQHMSSAVGYQFVRQYYTVLNKDPAKLHCFYKKNSLFTHGVEGDQSSDPAAGQIAINSEITALNFHNCKVAVSQLDTQPSANDGVIIMVLGSMSNNGGADRRFAQTFFLISEEPGRYYVLNDLFRFLGEPANPEPAVAHYEHAAPALSQVEHVQAAEPVVESTPAVSHPVVKAEVFEEPIHVPVPAPVEIVHEAPVPVHEVPVPVPAPAHVPAPAPVEVPQTAPVSVAPAVVAAPAPVQAPAQTPVAPKAKPTSWASAAAAAPPAQAPIVPKTTAPKAPKPAPAAAPAAAAAAAAPSTEATQEPAKERTERPERRAPVDHDHDSSVFIKGVTEDMEGDLKVAFAQYGQIRNVSFLKANNSAFVDYGAPDHADAAINAGSITLASGKIVKAEKRNRPRGGNSGSGSGSGSPSGQRRPQHSGPREPRDGTNAPPKREDRPPRRENAPATGSRPAQSGAPARQK